MKRQGRSRLAERSFDAQGGLDAATVLGAVVVTFLWALCYPLVTTTVSYAPPLFVGFLRALVAGLLLIVASIVLGRPRPRGSQWTAIALIGATSTALGFGGMFLAGGRVSPGLATVIANSQPLLAALLGQFVLEEGLGRWQILGMLLAFAGILELALPTLQSAPAESSSAVGVAFVLLGAVGVAGGNVAMKRSSALLDPIAATGWQLLIGSLLLFLAWAAGTSSQPIRIESAFVFALLGLAVLGTAVAFALWLALLPRAPLNTLNIFSFLTPVFALVIGAAFYDERLGGDQVVGAAVVLLGAALANRVAHSRPS